MKQVKKGDRVFVYDIIQTVDGPESIVYSSPVHVRMCYFEDDNKFVMIERANTIKKYTKWYETLQEASGAAHEELSGIVTEKKKLL